MSDKIYNVLFLCSAEPRWSPLDHIGQTPTEG